MNLEKRIEAEPILQALPVGVTIVDPEGCILFYNHRAAELVNRKPEHIGRNIRTCHEKKESIDKIDKLLAEFQAGRTGEFQYQAVRKSRRLSVHFRPVREGDRLLYLVQTIIPIEMTDHPETSR